MCGLLLQAIKEILLQSGFGGLTKTPSMKLELLFVRLLFYPLEK